MSHAVLAARKRPRVAPAVAAAMIAAAALVALAPGIAQAHVRVRADSTTTGGFSALTFRVPNESATASTVRLSVELPQDNPFLFVSTKPVPGWTVVAEEAPLPTPVEREGTSITKAVRTVTWTADGGAQIGPGQYQEFSISAGPLPAPGTLLLPAIQTYSDNSVVRWDEATPESGEEPEHPAPALVVTAAQTASSAPSAVDGPTSPTTAESADTGARVVGGAGFLLGATGLVAGLLALRRSSVASRRRL